MRLSLLLILFALTSCGVNETSVSETKNGGKVYVYDGLTKQYDIYEFDYKNHKYIYCQVRDGISMTHAGHCKCNIK